MPTSTGITRWLRAALALTVTWGVAFGVLGLLLGGVLKLVRPADFGAGEDVFSVGLVFALAGVLSGLVFAALLSFAGRGRTLHQIPLLIAGALGAASAGVAPLLLGTDGSMGVVTGAVGGLFAAGALAVARRGAPAAAASPPDER